MMDTREKMNYLIAHARADVQLAAVCFQFIRDAPAEERPQLLKEFFIGYKTAPTAADLTLPEMISDEEEKRCMLCHGRVTDLQIKALQAGKPTEDEFYAGLWEYLQSSPFLPDDKARSVALFDCAIDPCIPYFQIDRSQLLSMDNDEYSEACERIGDDVFARMKFILNTEFDQKTEQASLIVRMMDKLPDYASRCVFMTRIIAHYMLRFHVMTLDRALDYLRDKEV